MARIAPNRRWFGNTRLVGQEQLAAFRQDMAGKVHDPYTILLHQKKLPMGLLQDSFANAKVNLLATESFESVLGAKRTRKRPKLPSLDLQAMADKVADSERLYLERQAADTLAFDPHGTLRDALRYGTFLPADVLMPERRCRRVQGRRST